MGQVMNPDDQPALVCLVCGYKFGRGRSDHVLSTWRVGRCGVCSRLAAVITPDNFLYLKPEWKDRPEWKEQRQ
jgi:hypothetical protein